MCVQMHFAISKSVPKKKFVNFKEVELRFTYSTSRKLISSST